MVLICLSCDHHLFRKEAADKDHFVFKPNLHSTANYRHTTSGPWLLQNSLCRLITLQASGVQMSVSCAYSSVLGLLQVQAAGRIDHNTTMEGAVLLKQILPVQKEQVSLLKINWQD